MVNSRNILIYMENIDFYFSQNYKNVMIAAERQSRREAICPERAPKSACGAASVKGVSMAGSR